MPAPFHHGIAESRLRWAQKKRRKLLRPGQLLQAGQFAASNLMFACSVFGGQAKTGNKKALLAVCK